MATGPSQQRAEERPLNVGRKERKRRANHAWRKLDRTKKRELAMFKDHSICKKAFKKHVCTATPLPASLETSSLPVASTGYLGSNAPVMSRVYGLQELVKRGFELFSWDGRCVKLLGVVHNE
jgi:hypothetical protein